MWAVQNKLVANLVNHVNMELSTSDNPYQTAKVQYVS